MSESFKKEIYRLKRYYTTLRELLEVHFSGDTVIANEEANRNYLQLCFEIGKILKTYEFINLSKNQWRPFDNLLAIDPDYAEGGWELGGRQICANFQSRIEEIFIENGKQEYELDFLDTNMINSIRLFLIQYKNEKRESDARSAQFLSVIKETANKKPNKQYTVKTTQKPKKSTRLNYSHAKDRFDDYLVQINKFFKDGIPTDDNTVEKLVAEIYELIKNTFPDGQSKIFQFERQIEKIDMKKLMSLEKIHIWYNTGMSTHTLILLN